MADQTVRTIYEAVVSRAQRNLTNLARDTDKAADSVDKLDDALDSAGKKDVKPKIDVDIAAAEKNVRGLQDELKKLEANPTDPVLDLDIAKSQAKIEKLQTELQILSRMDASPQVEADTAKAEAQIEGLQNRIASMESLNAEVTVNADIRAARADLDEAESKLKALQGAKAEMQVTVDADQVGDDMVDAASKAGEEAGGEAGKTLLDGLNSTPVLGAVAGLVAAVGTYVGAGIIDGVLDSMKAEDVFGTRAGLDDATARKFGVAAGAAYSNAFGESIEDNLGTAQKALENGLLDSDATSIEAQKIIEQLSGVSEVLDVDVTEAAEAAGNMMKNGLAANAEEAFDVIVTGQQEGLNRSEDWIDTLREYSSMFESLGLSGAEAGGLIEQAMDAGARNSDVAADALKEVSIRAQDDSKLTRGAFEALKLDADDMGKKFRAGGDEAKEGLDLILDGIRNLDKDAQNSVGAALFGTQWEDMGNGAGVLAFDLDKLGEAWVNVGDTTDTALQRMSDNTASRWESMKRTLETAGTNVLGGLAAALEEPIAGVSDDIQDNSAEIIGFLIDVGGAFFDLARAAVEFGAQTVEVMGDVAGSMDGILRAIGANVEAFGILTKDDDMAALGQSIQDAADDMTTFADNSDDAADTIRTTMGGAIDEAEGKFRDWSGGALMQAEINDAINGMVEDTDRFVEHVEGLPDATITINGDKLGGEEALNELITEVSESDGTLTINGETVQAEDAVDEVIRLGNEGVAEITVTANNQPAIDTVNEVIEAAGQAVVDVTADTSPAEASVAEFSGVVSSQDPTMNIDANTYFAEDELRRLATSITDAGGTVEINGRTVMANEALDELETAINSSTGEVTINGITMPAEDSLYWLIAAINDSGGQVEIDGDNSGARVKTNEATAYADGASGTVDVNGDNSGAKRSADGAKSYADGKTGTVKVDAATSAARSAIDALTRTRSVTIVASVVGAAQSAVAAATGRANGGRIAKGLAYGGVTSGGYGVVPATYPGPGIDNVLWPLASGGQTLSQPLAGGEWVVNPISSSQHDATLRAINAGASRAEIAAMNGSGSRGELALTQHITGQNPEVVAALAVEGTKHFVNSQSTGYRGG